MNLLDDQPIFFEEEIKFLFYMDTNEVKTRKVPLRYYPGRIQSITLPIEGNVTIAELEYISTQLCFSTFILSKENQIFDFLEIDRIRRALPLPYFCIARDVNEDRYFPYTYPENILDWRAGMGPGHIPVPVTGPRFRPVLASFENARFCLAFQIFPGSGRF